MNITFSDIVNSSTLVFSSAMGWALIKLFEYFLKKKNEKIAELTETVGRNSGYIDSLNRENNDLRIECYEVKSKNDTLNRVNDTLKRQLEESRKDRVPPVKTTVKIKPNSIPAQD
jgi:FtsZ-binding cell division protein ZapB